jgi:hypothetical protein
MLMNFSKNKEKNGTKTKEKTHIIITINDSTDQRVMAVMAIGC